MCHTSVLCSPSLVRGAGLVPPEDADVRVLSYSCLEVTEGIRPRMGVASLSRRANDSQWPLPQGELCPRPLSPPRWPLNTLVCALNLRDSEVAGKATFEFGCSGFQLDF